MKFVMKADDGKEIIYISEDDYDVGNLFDFPDDIFIMINELPQEKKEYLEKVFETNETLESFMRNDDFVLETSEFYFLFAGYSNYKIESVQNNSKNNIIRIGFISLNDENVIACVEAVARK